MTPTLALRETYLAAKYPVWTLLAPTGGLFSSTLRLHNEPGAPEFEIATTSLGNVTKIFPHVSMADGRDSFDEPLGGAGADVGCELAWLRAVMEGAERYATMAYDDDDFVLASANELGAAAIDLGQVACCSAAELAHPDCPYIKPDATLPIRWARGISLTHGGERFVPAVMSHLYLKPGYSESFWQEISTGVAAHTRPEAAMLSAICEVIERDAIAITWLARLALPRILLRQPLPPVLAPNHRALQRSLIRQDFFDATTDIGIPIVYAVQTVEGDPRIAQYVSCAVAFDAAEALAKTIREAAPARPVLRLTSGVPDDMAQFRSLYDGAYEMGKPQHRGAFDFLLHSPRSITLDAMAQPLPADASEGAKLRWLTGRLAGMGLEVVIVDLTTDELRDVGVWVLRAVIPGLMPMSSVQRGRFLGTKRLYDYPALAGFGRLGEAGINPLPQPFA